jgi:hypothetical protein
MKSVKTIAAGITGAAILTAGLVASIAKAQSPTLHHVTVGALRFQPYDGSEPRNCNNQGTYCYLDSSGTLSAPLPDSIPDGAEIDGLTCAVYDGSATGYVNIKLMQHEGMRWDGTPGSTALAQWSTTAGFFSSEWYTNNTTTFAQGVDLWPSILDYSIWATFSEGGSNLRIQSCDIAYWY